VVLLQTPLMAGPFLLCAWLLLRVAAPRRSFGTRATGAVSMAIAGLWVLYAAAYLSLGLPPNLDSDGPAAFLLRYNSYVDLLLQMLLGFGMVVVLLEDAKREADDARAQLSIAHDRLKRASLYDALTGALNRRAFEDGVGLETVAARGTALVLDMDNLKVVNDTHGHRAGDDLLCRLVDALRASMRPEDRLYRWGGDEFVVLAPNAPAEALGPRIRAAVERANAEYAPDSPLRLQLSLGASSFSSPQEIGAAIERADRAMYEDKAHHRRSSRTAQPAL
jgi:diguanylate cyclase (GGDEF)-like protein